MGIATYIALDGGLRMIQTSLIIAICDITHESNGHFSRANERAQRAELEPQGHELELAMVFLSEIRRLPAKLARRIRIILSGVSARR